MKSKNHTLIAFILLVIILAPLSYSFIFQARQQRIQHRMKEELEHARLHHIIIPAAKLHWVKEGKEILVEGKMFDVKNITFKQDGNAYISGLFDEEETALVGQLKKDFEKERRTGSKEIVRLFQLVQSLPEPIASAPPVSAIVSQDKSSPGPEALPVVYTNILTPPPQC